LKFIDCPLFHFHVNDLQGIIDQIWNLPKSAHLYWHLKDKESSNFCIPTLVSMSLQYLTIPINCWFANQFTRLFDKTPNLRKFSTSLDSYEEDDRPPFQKFIPSPPKLSIKKLILSQIRSQREMTNLFRLLPNISHLKVEIVSIKLDGHRWEEIINNYFPELKIFHLKMNISLNLSIDEEINEKQVDQYLDTYRTPFWIEHHQWFIRCH